MNHTWQWAVQAHTHAHLCPVRRCGLVHCVAEGEVWLHIQHGGAIHHIQAPKCDAPPIHRQDAAHRQAQGARPVRRASGEDATLRAVQPGHMHLAWRHLGCGLRPQPCVQICVGVEHVQHPAVGELSQAVQGGWRHVTCQLQRRPRLLHQQRLFVQEGEPRAHVKEVA